MVKTRRGRAFSILMCLVLVAAFVPASALAEGTPLTVQAGLGVRAPRVVADSSMKAGQKATWDCVWFGSYPQEVVKDAATISALDAAGWSGNRATVGGATYQRLYEGDTTYNGNFSDYSSYYGSGGCLYFRCAPIKWRVLETDGSTALLLADQALDCQRYNSARISVTWETCPLRSWLDSSFKDAAFTSAEKAAIRRQTLANEDNPEYGTAGGNATSDDVFLLALSDVYGSGAPAHGFASDYSTYDEGRCAHVSDFARAMGGYRYSYHSCQPDSGYWWLRSPGDHADYASGVCDSGYVGRDGNDVSDDKSVVRPALRISLSSNQISYAGTVCSDGTEGDPEAKAPSSISLAPQTVTYTGRALAYTGKVTKSGSTGTVTYAYYSDKACTKEVAAEDVKNAGTYYVKATLAEDKGHASATSEAATFTIAKAANSIAVKTAAVAKTGNVKKAVSFTRAATAASGAVTYTSSSKYVAVSKTGKVTIGKNWTGTAKVTASSPEGANYKTAAPKSYTVKVKPGKMAAKKAANVKGSKVKVTWAKMAGADKYQVRVALNAKFTKGKKTYNAPAKAASKTTGKLAKGKTYYAQVRAYDKQTKSWGAWSAAKKVKVVK